MGSAMNYSSQVISCGSGTNTASLPNFVTSYFRQAKSFTYQYSVPGTCLTAIFSAIPCPYASPPVQQVKWVFGDPASGANNISTLQNPTHLYPSPGNYSVQCIVQFNCYTDTLKQVITINNYAPNIQILGSNSLCVGQSVTLTATGANSYTWSNGSINPMQVLAPGVNSVYTVNATGSNSNNFCTSTQTVAVTAHSLPTITAIADRTLFCNGEAINLNAQGASSYTWMPGSYSGSVITIFPQTGVDYTVVGQDIFGCEALNTIKVVMSYCANNHEIPNSISGFSVYPNPNDGHFKIFMFEHAQFEIMNVLGQTFFSDFLEKWEHSIDLSMFDEKVFILRINQTQSNTNVKVIVNR